MSEHVGGTAQLTRRVGVLVGILVAAGALMGCAAQADESTAIDAGGVDAAPAEAPAAGGDDGASGGSSEGAPSVDRAIIITGSLYITVEDPVVAAKAAEDIVVEAGGRIDARNEESPTETDGGSASLTMRIPSKQLEGVVEDLGALGEVDRYVTESADVTAQVTDLEARISTLRESTARIEGLLADASGISDIITLENELASRQAELESLEAQQRGLDDQVSMSTIELSLTTEPIVVEEVVDEGPQNFWEGLKDGWGALVSFVSAVLIVVGVLLPWLALLAILVGALVLAIRGGRARAAKRYQAAVAAASNLPHPPPAPGTPAPPAPQAPPVK